MRALPHALLVGALAAMPATAADWSLNGSVGQSFEANTNPGVEVDNDGATYGSITRLNLTLGAQTRRTSWALSSGAAISQFGGPGATSDLNSPNPNASGAVRYRGQRLDLGATANFSRQSTSFIDFNTAAIIRAIEEEGDDFDGVVLLPEDDLLIERESIRTLYSMGADARYRLTPLTDLRVSGTGAITRFTEEVANLTPNSSFAFGINLDHGISSLSRIGLNTTIRRFTADNAEDTRGLSVSFGGSYRTRLTPSTAVDLGLGAGFTRINEIGLGGLRETDTDVSFTGGLSGSYTPNADTGFRFSMSQAVRPSSDGDLVNVTSLGGILNYNLTRLSAFSVAASHSISNEIGSTGDDELDHSFIIGPTLSYRFAPDWTASLGYTFRFVTDDGDTAVGNRVFLGVTRSLAFFP
ncbi:MAG: hypothetical protein AAGC57_01050 [Pseudomonadota bacterium]